MDASFVQGSPSITVDSQNLPHVVYEGTCSSGFVGVAYARYDGLLWSRSFVHCASNSGAQMPSLALDSMDRPHVSYWHTGDLHYARWDGSTWIKEVADGAGDVGRTSHLKVDAQDRPHVAYRDLTNADFKYAFKDASGWHKEIIDTDGQFAGWNGLDLGPDGRPHVAYSAPGAPIWGALKYAVRGASGSWTIQVVDGSGGTDCAIAVDALGRPHISYRDDGEKLGYATFDGAQWDLQVVDRDSPTGWYTSIDTDSRNVPHIAYHQVFNRAFTDDPTRGHLKYASRLPTGQLVAEYADPVGHAGETSIVVDGLDRPRIAYHFSNMQLVGSSLLPDFDLKFAEPMSATTLGRLGE